LLDLPRYILEYYLPGHLPQPDLYPVPDVRVGADIHTIKTLHMWIPIEPNSLDISRERWQRSPCILQYRKHRNLCRYLICAGENESGHRANYLDLAEVQQSINLFSTMLCIGNVEVS